MRVLVTGSQGSVGSIVTPMIIEAGHEVMSTDRRSSRSSEWEHVPADITDPFMIRRLAMGMEAVVHLAAIAGERQSDPDTTFRINVEGTWNVLQAAAEVGAKKVVFFSSIQAIGVSGFQPPPRILPIDDSNPSCPRPAYGLSKLVGEEMCRSFTSRHGFSTYCLRPCFVSNPDNYQRWTDWDPPRLKRWMAGDLFAFVDVRDVGRAVLACLDDSVEGRHGRYLLSAADNMGGWDTLELVRECYPGVEWNAPEGYLDRPDRSLVNTCAIRNDLGWEPIYGREKKDV
jgi:nucleoside-diphosphate-sugar epimerase